MRTRLILYLLVMFISGCATTQNIQRPTSSLPAQGMARISLERESKFYQDGVRLGIVDNGTKVGDIAALGNLTWDRPAGIMNLTTAAYSNYTTKQLIIDVLPGFQYQIKVAVSPDNKWWALRFETIYTLLSSNKIPGYDDYNTDYASNTSKNNPVIPSTETAKDRPEKESKLASANVSPPETQANKVDHSPPMQLGKYYALVIGINDYKQLPKLKTATNDARVVRDILRDDYGFEVELLLDASRSDILLSLGKLRERLATTDNLLIYYAGHGLLDKDGDEGYWLPADASQDNAVNWVPNASVTTALKAMMAKHVLVVADSCYSGKLGRSVHIQLRNSDYYTRLSQKRARSVISSGGLEPVIDSGGKGRHSVFASAFIQALQENKAIMDSTELFSNIRRPIMLNSDQTPEYSDIRKADHDGGEFIFVRVNK